MYSLLFDSLLYLSLVINFLLILLCCCIDSMMRVVAEYYLSVGTEFAVVRKSQSRHTMIFACAQCSGTSTEF